MKNAPRLNDLASLNLFGALAENGLFLTDFELTTGGPRAETQAGQGIHQRGGAHGAHPHQGAAGADR